MSEPLLPHGRTRPQRLPLLDSADLRRPSTPNLSRVIAHHPALNAAWGAFAKHVLFEQTLPPRDREVAMLRIGWLNGADYEWCQHVRLARTAGLKPQEIRWVAEGRREGWASGEAVILEAVDDLFHRSTLDELTWLRLSENYNIEQILDLIFTVGQYNLVSWFLNSVGVPLDAGLREQAILAEE